MIRGLEADLVEKWRVSTDDFRDVYPFNDLLASHPRSLDETLRGTGGFGSTGISGEAGPDRACWRLESRVPSRVWVDSRVASHFSTSYVKDAPYWNNQNLFSAWDWASRMEFIPQKISEAFGIEFKPADSKFPKDS